MSIYTFVLEVTWVNADAKLSVLLYDCHHGVYPIAVGSLTHSRHSMHSSSFLTFEQITLGALRVTSFTSLVTSFTRWITSLQLGFNLIWCTTSVMQPRP